MQVICHKDSPAVWRIHLSAGKSGAVLIDPQGVQELTCILDDIEKSPACRVLVLEGESGRFCLGMDLEFITHNSHQSKKDIHEFARCLNRLCSCRQVVLAAVDGTVTGGGVGLAASADLVIATERSTFSLPEMVLGLLPSIIFPVLLERMPPQQARALALRGGADVNEAFRLGLVDQMVAEQEELQKAVRNLIKQSLRSAPEAVAGLKNLISELDRRNLESAFIHGAERTTDLLQNPERIQPIQAFLEGEPMPWFDHYQRRI